MLRKRGEIQSGLNFFNFKGWIFWRNRGLIDDAGDAGFTKRDKNDLTRSEWGV